MNSHTDPVGSVKVVEIILRGHTTHAKKSQKVRILDSLWGNFTRRTRIYKACATLIAASTLAHHLYV